jgi:hypothetical protein
VRVRRGLLGRGETRGNVGGTSGGAATRSLASVDPPSGQIRRFLVSVSRVRPPRCRELSGRLSPSLALRAVRASHQRSHSPTAVPWRSWLGSAPTVEDRNGWVFTAVVLSKIDP